VLITRSDDTPATVAARLENQLASLNDVVELYRASDRLQVVEGIGEIPEIQSRLAAATAAVGFTA
jgi:adenylate kinase family enzyme